MIFTADWAVQDGEIIQSPFCSDIKIDLNAIIEQVEYVDELKIIIKYPDTDIFCVSDLLDKRHTKKNKILAEVRSVSPERIELTTKSKDVRCTIDDQHHSFLKVMPMITIFGEFGIQVLSLFLVYNRDGNLIYL